MNFASHFQKLLHLRRRCSAVYSQVLGHFFQQITVVVSQERYDVHFSRTGDESVENTVGSEVFAAYFSCGAVCFHRSECDYGRTCRGKCHAGLSKSLGKHEIQVRCGDDRNIIARIGTVVLRVENDGHILLA